MELSPDFVLEKENNSLSVELHKLKLHLILFFMYAKVKFLLLMISVYFCYVLSSPRIKQDASISKEN